MILTAYGAENGVSIDYPKLFRFGVLNLLAGVNEKDAQVVIEMNFAKRNRAQFPGISAKLEMLPDVASVVRLVKQKQLHGVALTGIDYLALREEVALDPLFVSSRQIRPLETYVLLVQKHVTSMEQLSKLSRRRLVTENIGETNIGLLWLDTLLWKDGMAASKLFFSEIRLADKPARMVLPVFFGQAEVCLVPESVFTTMAELNPQIRQRLKVLKRSPEFVRSITCTIKHLQHDLVEAIKRNAKNMPHTVDGQQLMLIFQYRRHHTYDPAYLKATERIYHIHKRKLSNDKQ